MKNLKILSVVVAVVSGVAALISLAWSSWAALDDAKKARMSEWQEVAVYSVIERAGLLGVSFDDLRDAYLNDAEVFEEFEIPKSELQVSSLRRVLLRLIEKRAISPSETGNYRLVIMPGPTDVPPFIKRFYELQPVFDGMISLVANASEPIKGDKLYRAVQDKYPSLKITNDEFNSMLSALIAQRGLTVDKDGNLKANLNGSEE